MVEGSRSVVAANEYLRVMVFEESFGLLSPHIATELRRLVEVRWINLGEVL